MLMRLLLDESLPYRLKTVFPGHQVNTVTEMGWKSLSNGELLARASGLFQVFLTADKKLQYQQNIVKFDIALIVLNARQNRFVDYEPLIPRLLEALTRIHPGEVFRIGSRPAP
jgi:predicted nuclease of predicted toxin-antitoxin system